MTDTLNLSLALPQPLLRQIIAYQDKEKLESTSAAILDILSKFLLAADDSNANSFAPLERLEALEGKLQVWFSR